jgi:F-type H+-transporting ATPase subunit a
LEEQKTKKHGTTRWILLGLLASSIASAVLFPPIRPEIMLAAEHLTHEPIISNAVLGDVYLTNTMVAMLLVDLIIIFMILAIRKQARDGNLKFSGIAGVIEMLVEYIYDMTKKTAGTKWAKKIFPFFMTIFLVVLVANWMELIPGVDSIGLLHHKTDGTGGIVQIVGPLGILVKPEAGAHVEHTYAVIPFVRAMATDLNFTLTLALISVVMIQVFGLQAHGPKYLRKFFNFGNMTKSPMGAMDLAVGLLELISEFSKILSFTFRLFGSIFAGSVILFVIGSLVPVLAQVPFVLLELFFGLIQALVFGMLTMVLMSQAVSGHH